MIMKNPKNQKNPYQCVLQNPAASASFLAFSARIRIQSLSCSFGVWPSGCSSFSYFFAGMVVQCWLLYPDGSEEGFGVINQFQLHWNTDTREVTPAVARTDTRSDSHFSDEKMWVCRKSSRDFMELPMQWATWSHFAVEHGVHVFCDRSLEPLWRFQRTMSAVQGRHGTIEDTLMPTSIINFR